MVWKVINSLIALKYQHHVNDVGNSILSINAKLNFVCFIKIDPRVPKTHQEFIWWYWFDSRWISLSKRWFYEKKIVCWWFFLTHWRVQIKSLVCASIYKKKSFRDHFSDWFQLQYFIFVFPLQITFNWIDKNFIMFDRRASELIKYRKVSEYWKKCENFNHMSQFCKVNLISAFWFILPWLIKIHFTKM